MRSIVAILFRMIQGDDMVACNHLIRLCFGEIGTIPPASVPILQRQGLLPKNKNLPTETVRLVIKAVFSYDTEGVLIVNDTLKLDDDWSPSKTAAA